MTVLDRLGRFGLVDPSNGGRTPPSDLIDDLDIVCRVPPTHRELSGGNQQKAVLGRALASGPRVLVLGTRRPESTWSRRRLLLDVIQGSGQVGVVVVTDDLDELAICDRILVMFAGRIIREFGRARDDHELVAAMEGVDRTTVRG